jgi:hypothetical protein
VRSPAVRRHASGGAAVGVPRAGRSTSDRAMRRGRIGSLNCVALRDVISTAGSDRSDQRDSGVIASEP